MPNLLITGGAGFIGANFVHYWLRKHPDDRVVVLDALTYAGNRASLTAVDDYPQFRFVHGDICDAALLDTLFETERLDTVVHFAAESHVDRSIIGPDEFVRTNVVGTHTLLMAARRAWLDAPARPEYHRFHHVSTDEVYGSLGADAAPFTESTPYAPNSPYAASKAASDHLVRACHHTYGLQTTISNCSNNYGPFQFPEKLIPLMILNALRGVSLPVYGDGQNIRDWLHVEDHCHAIDLVLQKGQAGETYNVGGDCEQHNIDVVEMICTLVDAALSENPSLAARFSRGLEATHEPSRSLIRYVTDRPGHDQRYAINFSKIHESLGYSPKIGFEHGMQQTIQWYLDNQPWWESILDQSYRNWIKTNYESRLE